MIVNSLGRRLGLATFAIAAATLLSAANTGPITRLTIAPEAEIVPLFDGAEEGQFQVRMSAVDAHRSHVFITNTTSTTLNVALPKAAVGVHTLPQLNGFFGNNANGNANGNGNSPFGPNGSGTGLGNAAAMAQGVGGQFGATGGPNNGLGNTGFGSVPSEWADKPGLDQYAGFAAIPAGKTVQLQLRTVCLNYGRPEPSPKLPYVLTRVEKYTTDPVLSELLESYSPRVEQQVMQAAAWHVANGMTWNQLTQLPDRRLPGTSARVFHVREVKSAQSFVQSVQQQASKRPQPASSGGQVATTFERR